MCFHAFFSSVAMASKSKFHDYPDTFGRDLDEFLKSIFKWFFFLEKGLYCEVQPDTGQDPTPITLLN